MLFTIPMLSSTQDVLKCGADLCWPDGLLIIADQQTSGRGRQGRAWVSPFGNFYGSYLYRNMFDAAQLGWLSLAVGVSVIEALKSCSLFNKNKIESNKAWQLKWPNDILLHGKKLAGLLIEREGDALIIGLGVNLQHAPPITDGRYQAISLNEADLPAPTALEFAETWQQALQQWLTIWQQQDFTSIKAAWLKHHPPLGTALQIKRDDTILNGTFAGLAADGALRLQTETELLTLHTADVFFLASP